MICSSLPRAAGAGQPVECHGWGHQDDRGRALVSLSGMARWIVLAVGAGIGLSTLGIQFADSGDQAPRRLVLMLATWGVLAFLGYRRARTVRAIRGRMASGEAGEPSRHAGWVAGASALGAALGTAYAQKLAGVPLVITVTWMVLGFLAGAFFFGAVHGDRAGTRTEGRAVAVSWEGRGS